MVAGPRKVPPKRTKSELQAAIKLLLIERFGGGAQGNSEAIDHLTNYFTAWDLEAIHQELLDLQIARLKTRDRVARQRSVSA